MTYFELNFGQISQLSLKKNKIHILLYFIATQYV